MTEENQANEGETQEAFVEGTSEGVTEDSVFDEIFAESTGNPFEEAQVGDTQQGVEPQQEQYVQEESNNPESDSYKYWQSEADKRAYERDEAFKTLGVSNVDELKNVSQEMQDILPIAKYIKSNPDVLNVVDKSLRGEQIGDQREPENQKAKPIEKPVKPVRPSGYDEIEAYQDNESSSWKYRVEMEQYRDDMIDYTQKENESLKDSMTQREQAQIRSQQIGQLQNELTSRGYTPQQADDFIQWASSDDSFTVDNLIQLHGQIRGIQAQQPAPQSQELVDPQVQNKVQQMIQQRQRLSQPGPVATAGGPASQSNRSVEDRVMDEMVGKFNKLNPF